MAGSKGRCAGLHSATNQAQGLNKMSAGKISALDLSANFADYYFSFQLFMIYYM